MYYESEILNIYIALSSDQNNAWLREVHVIDKS